MARTRQIGRAAIVAREHRPSAAEVDAATHAQYRAMLTDDFGPATFTDRHVDDGRPVGIVRLLLRPSGLFFIATIAFIAVAGIKLWQMGVFAPLFAPRPVVVEKGGVRFTPGPRHADPYVAADNAAPIFETAPIAVKPAPRARPAEAEADDGAGDDAPEADSGE